jgi:hypothetical protein
MIAVGTSAARSRLITTFSRVLMRAGEFGGGDGKIARVAIPGHMLGTLSERDVLELIDAHSFRLGTRSFGYDRWGLHRLA